MRKFLWSLFETIETLVIALVVVFLVRNFVAQPFLVSGASMEPNFQNGDYLLIDELTYRFRSPERGEVVVFRYPRDERTFYIKRIIGLPGEKLKIESGKVSVLANDAEKVLSESYLDPREYRSNFEISLGQNEYFVLGDNRNFSFDSRSWGALQAEKIVGVVRLRLWPIPRVMAFSAPAY